MLAETKYRHSLIAERDDFFYDCHTFIAFLSLSEGLVFVCAVLFDWVIFFIVFIVFIVGHVA